MQREFEKQFEQIKIEKKPTFDPYLDGQAGYGTFSELLQDEPTAYISQQVGKLKLIAINIKPNLKSPKHRKQKTIKLQPQSEEEANKDKIH